jgi:uncharacterized protein (DUF1697 family)
MTYVALLRAINLGAKNKIPMAALRTLFEALGAKDVRTYVQSGNVVFESNASARDLRETIEKAIEHELGLDVTVLLRSARQLARIVRSNPFSARDQASLHVTFLEKRPKQSRVRALDPNRSPPGEFRVAGTEVYLHCPNGYGRSKLSNAFFETGLDVAGTTRNWRTVTALAELAATR